MNGGMSGLVIWGLRIAAVVALVILLPRLEQLVFPREAPADPVRTKAIATALEDTSHLVRIPQHADPNIKSVLNIPARLKHGEFAWNDRNVPAGPVWVRVDLSKQILSVFRAGHEIGTAVITYGAGTKPTPAGKFNVLWKQKDHQSSLYDAAMPYTLRLTNDGVSIHGGDVQPGRATHGCVGVPIGFARLVFSQVGVGDPVVVLPAGGPGAGRTNS